MADEPPAPGSNICGEINLIGDSAEICTFPPHSERQPHFWSDFQQYTDRVLAYYDTLKDELGQLSKDLKRERDKFIYRSGVALQKLQDETRGSRDPEPGENLDPMAPPGVPYRPPPEDEKDYPPLRSVKEGEAAQELGICGTTKVEDGEFFICMRPPHDDPHHQFVEYSIAIDNSHWTFEMRAKLSRDRMKALLDIVSGRRPKELPPFGQDINPPGPEPVDPNDDTVELPTFDMPDMPELINGDEDDAWMRRRRGHPGRPRTRDEEGRYPLDLEKGGGHVGRGPGDPRWEEARDKGAKWDEDSSRPPVPATPSEPPPLPSGVEGVPAGQPEGRKAPTLCRRAERRADGLYTCVKEFGHIRRNEICDFRKVENGNGDNR